MCKSLRVSTPEWRVIHSHATVPFWSGTRTRIRRKTGNKAHALNMPELNDKLPHEDSTHRWTHHFPVLTFLLPCWPHLEGRDSIWVDDWSHSLFVRPSPSGGFLEFSSAVRQMPENLSQGTVCARRYVHRSSLLPSCTENKLFHHCFSYCFFCACKIILRVYQISKHQCDKASHKLLRYNHAVNVLLLIFKTPYSVIIICVWCLYFTNTHIDK